MASLSTIPSWNSYPTSVFNAPINGMLHLPHLGEMGEW